MGKMLIVSCNLLGRKLGRKKEIKGLKYFTLYVMNLYNIWV